MDKAFCSRCCKDQPYEKSTRPIKFGFNDKEFTTIEGVVYTCSVCGFEVKTREAFAEHEKQAREQLERGNSQPKKQQTEQITTEIDADTNTELEEQLSLF